MPVFEFVAESEQQENISTLNRSSVDRCWRLTPVKATATLLIDCPDRKGLVAQVSGLLYEEGANILHADQHRDQEAGLFFMRVEWALDGFDVEHFRSRFALRAAGRGGRGRGAVST